MHNDYDPLAISVAEAWQQIEHSVQPIQDSEIVPLEAAFHRILAEDCYSRINVPPHTNSAMDGYAIRGADLADGTEHPFTIVGTAWAGKPYTQAVSPKQCVRIFTGAFLPLNTDTVIMQEHVTVQDNRLTLTVNYQLGQYVRAVGEDIKIGQLLLSKGKRLRPADLGLLASVGTTSVRVARRLNVAFLSIGDELCLPGERPHFGQIYDSNHYTLLGMLTELGNSCITCQGIIPDRRDLLEQMLVETAAHQDVIITSGGVSVGEADYVTDILKKIGQMNFWKVAMKPGRPLTFGKIQQAVFFGLPGNPVSVMVTFQQFVRPALRRLLGQAKVTPLRLKVPCISPLQKVAGRLELQRGILEMDSHGQLVVRSTGAQGSGILSSMSQANCFIVLPAECENLPSGSEVWVEPFSVRI